MTTHRHMRRKNHWYDGLFYATFIDPWLRDVRRLIADSVEEGSSVVDIGCGTGELVRLLAPRCRHVLGLELSPTMLRYARKRAARIGRRQAGRQNVEFRLGDIRSLTRAAGKQFDYAVACMVLHEVPRSDRKELLRGMASCAARVVVADYAAPFNSFRRRVVVALPEFLAGAEHFRSYRSFASDGGLAPLLSACRLKVERDVRDSTGTYRVVTARSVRE